MTLPRPVEGLVQPTAGPLLDRFARRHDYLRISVTDRCNYRCTYCMPAEGLDWLPKSQLLTFEEIERIATAFAGMGVRRLRLTGGEPTVRRGLPDLVARLAAIPGIDDIALTTNAHLFAKLAGVLAGVGLRRVNISIDAIDPDRFREITRGGDVHRVLAAIDASLEAGLSPVKLNCVVIRGVNEEEIVPLVQRFAGTPVQVRFIEYMPFDQDSRKKHIPGAEVRARLAAHMPLEPAPDARVGGGPAATWRVRDTGQIVGFISPITEHFCEACNRLRLSADGHLRTCLSRDRTPSLRDLLRGGATDADLASAIRGMVWGKVAGHEAHLDSGWRGFEGVMTRIGG
ncbi:MAG: GTP 3',8-cyclase MoaA [Deltaproteobacteria bacterium]|nr:GTP 3',8-cyclase MoaA [Deltaproteobacteria bacterium]